AYALRQSAGEGTIAVDNLKAGTSFTAVTGLPSAPPPPPPAPSISGISIVGGSIVINGTNNNATGGQPYYVLTTTNILLPATNWTRLSTNLFNANGSFSYT